MLISKFKIIIMGFIWKYELFIRKKGKCRNVITFSRNMITFWHKLAQGYDKRNIYDILIDDKGFDN